MMRALLRAGLRRDLRSGYTWLALLISLLCGLIAIPVLWRFDPEYGMRFYLDSEVLVFALIFGLAVSAALRMLRGALEHESGMSRNKLIGGASKGELLLTEMIIAAGTALVQCILTVCPVLYAALLYVQYFTPKKAAQLFLLFLACYLFFAVLMTLIWYYARSSAAIVVTGCVLFAVTGMGGLMLTAKLQQPQYSIEDFEVVRNEQGEVVSHREKRVRNPQALHGPLRTVCEVLDTVNPVMAAFHAYIQIEQSDMHADISEKDAEGRASERHTLYYCPAALSGLTLLMFAGGLLFAPNKNFN